MFLDQLVPVSLTSGCRRIPNASNFETECEAIETGLRRMVEGRATVMRNLIQAVYRFRDTTLVAEKG